MHSHKSRPHIFHIHLQVTLEEVEDSECTLFRLLCIASQVRLRVDVGLGASADLIAVVLDFTSGLRYLNDFVDEWISFHIDHAKVLVSLPSHESSLFEDLVLQVRVIAQEGGWDPEDNAA